MFAAINTFLSGGASAPLNTLAPAVTGTAAAGQTLSCTTGTWTGSLPITYTYQWQHGTTNIASATSSTYVLDRSYIGETIRCVVTATNAIGAPTANSNATSAVVAVPLNTVAPAVTGTATNGQTLTSSTGTWTGTATISFAYQWKRGGTNVGSNSTTYALVDADVGSAMSCVVTGTNGQGSATGTSNSTGAIAARAPSAPTGVSASATGSTTATVSFTPGDTGGASVTYYVSGGGSGSSSGSPIYVTGLAASTGYSFTVTAYNSAGSSSASSASGSITTSPPVGQQLYTGTSSSYSWTAPAGVTSVSVVCIGPGYSGYAGALGYLNNYSVTPGNSYSVQCSFNQAYFVNTSTCQAGYVSHVGTGGGNMGSTRNGSPGAGGYSGDGGSGSVRQSGWSMPSQASAFDGPPHDPGTAGSGGGGGGGGQPGEHWDPVDGWSPGCSSGSGGVGALGQGSNGAGGGGGSGAIGEYTSGGGGGSGGGSGTGSTLSYSGGDKAGGNYGGAQGGLGAVRIIWPGTTRSFPSTNTGDM